MIDLRYPRFCALFLLVLALCCACQPEISSAQSGTAEVRASDLGGPQPQKFDERAAQAQVQWVQQNDPQLWKLLVQWEDTTKGYQKLSGGHRRYVYDTVFQVEKRADGKFYYEAPDKGRIDIEPVEVGENAKSQKLSPQGKPYSLKSDREELWICDGKRIAQATDNGAERIYTIFPIPKMNQGVNIMDGPLPFLFGLPANEAVTRYEFKVLTHPDPKIIWLKVLPKREQDQQNWKQAEIMLDHKTFLPMAVKLLDHAGTTETVYSFSELKVNGNVILDVIFGRDPFNIEKVMKEKGFKEVRSNIVQGNRPPRTMEQPGPVPLKEQPQPQPRVAEGDNPPQKMFMPDITNAYWAKWRDEFEKRGFKVIPVSAGPAPGKDNEYHIAGSKPKKGTQLQPGQEVIFYIYEEVKAASRP